MNSPKVMPSPQKGRVKCFQCRELCLSKNGSWHNREQGQIFLCEPCEKANAAPAKTSFAKRPTSAKRG